MVIKNLIVVGYKCCVLVYIMLLIISCKRDRFQVDVSGIPMEVKANRLEEDLFLTKGENISFLKYKYGSFFDLYCYQLTETGSPDTILLKSRLLDFTTDADMAEIFSVSEKIFQDFTAINEQLTAGFKHYKYHFPKKTIPEVVTFISGFNYAVVATDSVLGVGLDMYLGSDSKYYPALQYPGYKIARMRKEYLAMDALRGWVQSEWEQDPAQSDLLSQMIYEGKILYLLVALMPDEPDSVLTRYTSAQLKWSEANEKSTWSFFIEQNILFTNDQQLIAKFIIDGPTTNGFPKGSPGAIGQWVGWKMIESYMKKSPTVTLSQLMDNNDYKKIFQDSKYKPGK